MLGWTLFLYTGHGLEDFRANVPDNIVVFANGKYEDARRFFIENVGKEPELMGYQYTEGASKEIVWQKAIDSSLISDDVGFKMAMSLEGTLVLEPDESSEDEIAKSA